ncbi:MAG TPA: cytochrome b/b6 domain-containing protein [Deltaproteobacteria bacterium]|nr:cytochrome b/b6 domain-containing protein [Deltaproteobacteria bacterium]
MDDHALILKHPLRVRMFHYILVISFLPLALTGLALFFKAFDEPAMNLVMRIHVVAGVVLTLGSLGFFVIAYDRVVLFIRRSFAVTVNDVKWFAVLGGYPQKFLLRKKVAVPPMGKYNSGQKLFGACMLTGGALIIATGWGLWGFPHLLPHGMAHAFGEIHLILGLFLTLFLCVHVFLGIYMFHDFKAMFLHGRIPYAEAREAAPLWVENELVALRKE